MIGGLSTNYSHSPTHAYFSSAPSTVKDDYLLTRSLVVPAKRATVLLAHLPARTQLRRRCRRSLDEWRRNFADLHDITQGSYTGQISGAGRQSDQRTTGLDRRQSGNHESGCD